ncbi:antA/AntB antirepressor family protein [Yersinia enterocolitica]|uniref:antA/AntB antirepressor family protein n=1 Tax=Yersinia enterocolitica TaxID=630 RepID=UPI001C8E8910|nr:antA/AntB antirepressor family protein [Yersinia enterocolitica]MBX9477466.1 antA/AntB antirepressor family protein [Yersinia enterocolitica]
MKLQNTPVCGRGFVQPENQKQKCFVEMIPVIFGVIGNHKTGIVSAKALHSVLGVKRVFSSWFNSRVVQYGFTRGADFDQLTPDRVEITKAGRPEVNYVISLNMAKELAMVERTEQGRAVRRYFIKCEEELHKSVPEKAAALRQELKARITAASYFKPMCAALDLLRAEQGKTTQHHHYTTEANMLARIVLGDMTAKQWAQANDVTGEPRDHMSMFQLEHLSYLEQSNITLIELGQGYHQRKAELIRLSQRWLARRMEASNDYPH